MKTNRDSRNSLRPILFPEYLGFQDKALRSPWNHHEVSMVSDVKDFNESPKKIRELVGGILRGFTLTESLVGDYWATVRKNFKSPEVQLMCSAFSHQEAVHLLAYDHLDASLGLDSYQQFQASTTAVDKLSYIEKAGVWAPQIDLALSLALFSGGVEGVSLFSSFAILLSLSKDGLFKGMTQLLSWSVLDENLHSLAGVELYKSLGIPSENIAEGIYRGFDTLVANELAFVDVAFENGDIEGCITKGQAIAFINHRANKKLSELGLSGKFLDKGYEAVAEWFYPMVNSTVRTDFFALAKNGGGYVASLDKDFSQVDFNLI